MPVNTSGEYCGRCGNCLLSGRTGHLHCDSCNCTRREGDPGFVPYESNGHNRCGFVGSLNDYLCTRAIHSEDQPHVAHARNASGILVAQRTWFEPAIPVCADCGRPVVAARRCQICGSPQTDNRILCNRCCGCNTQIPFVSQTAGFHVGEANKRFPRYVGVEVECGKLPGSKGTKFQHISKYAEAWGSRIGSDGSLRDFTKSTEISTTPSRGPALERQLKDLSEALIADDLKANSSCGFHVHVDVRDYTPQHLLNFVYLWERFEPLLYKLVAPSRWANHYSKPWLDKFSKAGVMDRRHTVQTRIAALDKAIYGSTSNAETYKRGRSKHESRYHGMNLNSIFVHGTIEFRLHHGTVNLKKMLNWVALCSAIVQYAFEHSEEEIYSMKGTTTIILQRVLDDPEVMEWVRARRIFFSNAKRKRMGLPPHAKPVRPLPDPGETELSEDAA